MQKNERVAELEVWAPRGGTLSPIQRDSCDLQAAEEMASEGRVRKTSLEAKFVLVDVFDENNGGGGDTHA